MPLKVVRNDITKMNTEAIVNTANRNPVVGSGCDSAVYKAAGYDKLLAVRKQIGEVPEGDVFITDGFDLAARYIIHVVSPRYIDGESGEEQKLRACYRKSLELAVEKGIKSIAFPLISTGNFGYPKIEGLRIAMDEINAFLMQQDMDVSLVVFGSRATGLAQKLFPRLKEYIDQNYVDEKEVSEYGYYAVDRSFEEARDVRPRNRLASFFASGVSKKSAPMPMAMHKEMECEPLMAANVDEEYDIMDDYEDEIDEAALQERIRHISDPFGVYFFYIMERKEMTSQDIQNGAWITKQVYHKIKKDPVNYHPDKDTALRLSVALKLNLDETKDFLARAGYAFSCAMKKDIIWQFGIENKLDIYDMSDLMEDNDFPPLVNF